MAAAVSVAHVGVGSVYATEQAMSAARRACDMRAECLMPCATGRNSPFFGEQCATSGISSGCASSELFELSHASAKRGGRRTRRSFSYGGSVPWCEAVPTGRRNQYSSGSTVCCENGTILQERPSHMRSAANSKNDLTVVMKFGGSSVATAERMKEVAQLITSFSDECPVIVLSAMGKTTNNLLQAGEKAVVCGADNASQIQDILSFLSDLHLRTADELGVERSLVEGLLDELSQLLTGIALMKELTARTRDYLVSFGERMSTRLFAAYLNKMGVNACQYDSFEIGFTTTDDFTNAEVLGCTYSAVGDTLRSDWEKNRALPIVTGFLGKGIKTGAVTTLGRGGSDLTATAIGKALGLREIQVWKDVDGVLTADPHLVSKKAVPVPFLTFDEAAELAYFGAQVLHPQAMRPACDADIPVRVKNSYNPAAAGTLITRDRDMNKALLTSIVLKPHVTMLDIVSTRMLGQFGFLAKVFSIFEDMGISVDVVATSEVSVSLTLDPARMWTRELIQQELDRVVEALSKIAIVKLAQKKSIISLIGNVQRSSLILEKVFSVFRSTGINVQMISQGASKVNISVIVDDDEAELCVRALHCVFFEQEHLVEKLLAGYGNGDLDPCC